jgi:ABC-2 type transport system permease protein
MKKFKGFVYKEFLHIIRDPRSMLILIGMPVVQILLFGFVLTNEIRDADLAILDHSKDNTTTAIIQKLTASGYFRIKEQINHAGETDKLLKSGKVKQVLIFEPDFEQNIIRQGKAGIQIISDASDPNLASMLSNYTLAVISEHFASLATTSPQPLKIETQVRMLYNEELRGVYMFVPGTMALILLLLSAMMTSISIAREKETGTMENLLVSPLRPVQIILGKVTPYMGMAFFNAIMIILLGVFVFQMPVMGNLTLLMLLSLVYIGLALALGIMISSLVKTQQVAMFISMFALLLPTILLSGFIFPVSNMPLALQWLSHIIPAKYYIIIIKNILLKGTGFAYVWQETLVLVIMMIVFIIVSIRKFKIRLE